MKKLILFLLLPLMPSIGFSQLSVGIAGGYTSNWLDADGGYYDRNYSPKDGFLVAVPVQYDINRWLAVKGELGYMNKSYSSYFTYTHEDAQAVLMQSSGYKNSFVQLPLMASFSVGGDRLRAFVNVGGYLGVWTSSSISGCQFSGFNDDVYETFDYKYSFNSEADRRFDAGLLCGIGMSYALSDRIGVFAEGRYLYGLTNMQKDYMYNLYPRYNQTLAVQIGVTYNFKFRKN